MTAKHSISIILILSILLTACTTALPQGPGGVWDLVIIGDSSLWLLGDAYAAQIEKDAGVQVTVHDYANEAGSAGEVLAILQGEPTYNVRLKGLVDTLKEAEVVVIFLNPEDSVVPDKPMDFWQCFQNSAPGACDPASFEQWTADLKAIWTEIYKLRRGKETILRAVDLYNPAVAPWQEYDVFEACTTCWERQSDAVRLAAEGAGVPFLSRLDAFNGLDHNEDPRAKGYIREDGEHPSELGAQVTAELLGEMGYEPTQAP